MKGSHFFALLSRMKYIARWSLMRSTVPENIAEHSLQVAQLAHVMALVKNEKFGGSVNPEHLATMALYHDVPEIITGDLPTPVKYHNSVMRDAYREVEEESCGMLLSLLPEKLQGSMRPYVFQELTAEEKAIVKAADKLSAYFKCLEECQSGNGDFARAAKSTREAITAMQLPEADYMLKEFEDGFRKTLDEMR